MKTAVAQLTRFIENDSETLSKEYVLKILKHFETIQDNQLKTAYLHGRINVLQGCEGVSCDEYFEKEFK